MTIIRRYRLLYTVLAGLMLISAKRPDLGSGPSQQATTPPLAQSVANIAARQNEAADRATNADHLDAQCGPKRYANRSELCAQWKAADAAADSAQWAWLSWVISIGSLIGVGVAISQTFVANNIARDAARRQMRAYLALPKLKGRIKEGHLELKLLVNNTGQTPALNVIAAYNVKVSEIVKLEAVGVEEYVAAQDRRYLAPAQFKRLDSSSGRFTVEVLVKYNDVFRKGAKPNCDSESYTGDFETLGSGWTAITTRAWVREAEAEPHEEAVADAGTNG